MSRSTTLVASRNITVFCSKKAAQKIQEWIILFAPGIPESLQAVRGVADSVSMWNSVERLTTFAANIPQETELASNLDAVGCEGALLCGWVVEGADVRRCKRLLTPVCLCVSAKKLTTWPHDVMTSGSCPRPALPAKALAESDVAVGGGRNCVTLKLCIGMLKSLLHAFNVILCRWSKPWLSQMRMVEQAMAEADEDGGGGGKKGWENGGKGYDWGGAGKELSLQTRRAADTPAGLEMIKHLLCGVTEVCASLLRHSAHAYWSRQCRRVHAHARSHSCMYTCKHTHTCCRLQVCLRYFPGAPMALKSVSFQIYDKEKVGVVGRTGSGSSSNGANGTGDVPYHPAHPLLTSRQDHAADGPFQDVRAHLRAVSLIVCALASSTRGKNAMGSSL
eukprot:1159055-Pelagomonas_calceolata.AAC.8